MMTSVKIQRPSVDVAGQVSLYRQDPAAGTKSPERCCQFNSNRSSLIRLHLYSLSSGFIALAFVPRLGFVDGMDARLCCAKG